MPKVTKAKKNHSLTDIFSIEQNILDTNAGKQLSYAATDV